MGDNSESHQRPMGNGRALTADSPYAQHWGLPQSTAAAFYQTGWGNCSALPNTPRPDFNQFLQECQAEADTAPANMNAPIPELPAEARQLVPGNAFEALGINLNRDAPVKPQLEPSWQANFAQQNVLPFQPAPQQYWSPQFAQPPQLPQPPLFAQPVQDWQNQQAPLLPPLPGTENANPAPAYSVQECDQPAACNANFTPACSMQEWNQPAAPNANSAPACSMQEWNQPAASNAPPTLAAAMDRLSNAQMTVHDVLAALGAPIEPVASAPPSGPAPKKTQPKGKGKGKAATRAPVAEKAAVAPEPKKRVRRVAAKKAAAAITAAAEDVDVSDSSVDPAVSAPPAPAPAPVKTTGGRGGRGGHGGRRKSAKAAAKTHKRTRSSASSTSVALSISDIKMDPIKPRRNQNQRAVYYPPRKLTPWTELMARHLANSLPSVKDGKIEVLYTDDHRAPHGREIGVRRVCGECNKLLPYPGKKVKDDEPNETVRLGVMPGTTVMLHCNACGIYQRDKVQRRAFGMWGITGHVYADGDKEYVPMAKSEHKRKAGEREQRKRIDRKFKTMLEKLKKEKAERQAARLAVLCEGGEGETPDVDGEYSEDEEPEYDIVDIEVWGEDE